MNELLSLNQEQALPEHLEKLLLEERLEDTRKNISLLSLLLFLSGVGLTVQHLTVPAVPENSQLWQLYLGAFIFIGSIAGLIGVLSQSIVKNLPVQLQIGFNHLIGLILVGVTTSLTLLDLRAGNDISVFLVGVFLIAIGFRLGKIVQIGLISFSTLVTLLVLSLADYEVNVQILLAVIIYATLAIWIAWSLEDQRSENLLLRGELSQRNQELQFLSSRDALTGAYNRRAFFEYVTVLAEQSKRYRTDLTVAIIDVDKFKRVNDTLGHDAGDRVLKAISDCLIHATRKCDITARYGGEEFVTVMSNTHLKSAMNVAERLRKEIEFLRLPEVDWNVTVSIGVAMYRPTEETFDETLIRADRALYEGKELGGNTVTAARLTATDKDQI
jgi:diguanylate cyclase (GGDEF)-like protein